MSITIKTDCDNVNWQEVADLLAFYGLSQLDAEKQKLIFTRSYAVIFLIENDHIVGVGRALSDGICQAAIYNIALAKHLHGQQYGRLIVEHLVEQVKECNIILYTHPQTVKLYQHLGFDLMKTGLAKYQLASKPNMQKMGFI